MSPRAKHILIVDDYSDALDICAIHLRSIGYRVSTAVDGVSAIAKAEQLQPDLIVLDLDFPGISGFEAAGRLRNNPITQDVSRSAEAATNRAAKVDHTVPSAFALQHQSALADRVSADVTSKSQPSHVAVAMAHENR
jgi:CheY-like chemotaxis protein